MNKSLIIEKKQLLNEDKWETILGLAGYIPVIGEIFDIVLIIRYIIKKEYLYAALMLIALIPTVGDLIAKPFIAVLKGLKGPAGKLIRSNSDEFVKFLEKNPTMKAQYQKMGGLFNHKSVNETVESLNKVPGLSGVSKKLKESVDNHKSIWSTLFAKPQAIGRSIGREIASGATKPIGKGISKYFRREELKKYIIKNGHAPSNWFKKWWFVVKNGRYERRKYVKQFIIANKILDMFGLPSFEAFERKVENDENFRDKLTGIPIIGDLIHNTTSEEDLNNINKKDDEEEKPNMLSTLFTLGMLKSFAKKYV